jgi:hypothetical protein
MDGVRLDAISSSCVVCKQRLCDRHRVVANYRLPGSSPWRAELTHVGLVSGEMRFYWTHVDCADPTLAKWKMFPSVQHCMRCRQKLKPGDIFQAFFGVQGVDVPNPADPTDRGLVYADRAYFIHADCKNPQMTSGDTLLVTP